GLRDACSDLVVLRAEQIGPPRPPQRTADYGPPVALLEGAVAALLASIRVRRVRAVGARVAVRSEGAVAVSVVGVLVLPVAQEPFLELGEAAEVVRLGGLGEQVPLQLLVCVEERVVGLQRRALLLALLVGKGLE